MLDNGNCVYDITTELCYGRPYVYLHNGTCTASCGEGFYGETN